MKYLTFSLLFHFSFSIGSLAQSKVNPFVSDYGGIYPIDEATMKPDPDLSYKVVIDITAGPGSPHQINPALNNVARLLNLHVVGGVPQENMDVVLAIHGDATVAVLNHKAYEQRFEMRNPNVGLIEALKQAGVKLTVCGQSLIGHDIGFDEVRSSVEIATSMLTTVTTHQLKGYAFLRF